MTKISTLALAFAAHPAAAHIEHAAHAHADDLGALALAIIVALISIYRTH